VETFFDNPRQFRSGYYFTVTTKLANIFDSFGTAQQGLESVEQSKQNDK
jgi:hypothetical protein